MNLTVFHRFLQRCHAASVIFIFFIFSTDCLTTENDSFLQQFTRNYEQQNFSEQVSLVKNNKDIIPATIAELTAQALREELGIDEKMRLLNMASSMAYMHSHWNGDTGPLKTLDPIITREQKKEQERLDKLFAGKKSERFLGNFVMSRHEDEMTQEGLPVVLYPHWLHRIMFECKVCHDSIFKMKRWANNISQQNIIDGKQCGICHNGSMAFAADKDCERCHLVGTPAATHLHNPADVSQQKIKQAAESIGAQWRPERLLEGKLPLDQFQFIDWLELKKRDVFTPIVSLKEDYQEQTRDNRIFFKSKSDFVHNVLFDHKVHSDWIECSSCHPAYFIDKLGGNNIKMMDMHKGRYCGHCHGKVSFTFADCKRCHKESNQTPPIGALIRE